MSLEEVEKFIHEIKKVKSEFEKKDEEIERLKLQLAEKEKEVEKIKKETIELQIWKGVAESTIEYAAIGLNQTKKFFKSKTIAKIREELIDMLPADRRQRLIFKIQPDQPWPRPPEEKIVIIGYQPKSGNLDSSNPPQGGSGLNLLKECKTCNNAHKIPCPACGDSAYDYLYSEPYNNTTEANPCACCKGKRKIRCPDRELLEMLKK